MCVTVKRRSPQGKWNINHVYRAATRRTMFTSHGLYYGGPMFCNRNLQLIYVINRFLAPLIELPPIALLMM